MQPAAVATDVCPLRRTTTRSYFRSGQQQIIHFSCRVSITVRLLLRARAGIYAAALLRSRCITLLSSKTRSFSIPNASIVRRSRFVVVTLESYARSRQNSGELEHGWRTSCRRTGRQAGRVDRSPRRKGTIINSDPPCPCLLFVDR